MTITYSSTPSNVINSNNSKIVYATRRYSPTSIACNLCFITNSYCIVDSTIDRIPFSSHFIVLTRNK